MTLSWSGFDGTVDEGQWASISGLAGADSGFANSSSFKPSVDAAGARRVKLQPGAGGAISSGVIVDDDAETSILLDDIGSGSRWDVVVIRRDWTGDGGTASIIKINGPTGGAKTLPVLENTPGEVEDQLVCWAQLTAGNPTPVVEDLRTHTAKVIAAPTLQAIRNPKLGYEAVLPDGRRYRYELINGTLQWRGDRSPLSPMTLPIKYASDVWTSAAGFTTSSLIVRAALVTGNVARLDLQLRRSSSTPIVNTTGNFADTLLGTFKPPYRSDFMIPVPIVYSGQTASTSGISSVGGTALLNTNGELTLVSGTQGYDIYQRPAGEVSIRASMLIVNEAPFFPTA